MGLKNSGMPKFGFNPIGFSSGNNALADLKNNSTALWYPKGSINSPFTNPMVDRSNNDNDATLVNYAETTLSGYDVITAPNGKEVTVLKSDGVDDYCTLQDLEGLDPTGSDDFAMGFVFKTSTVGSFKAIYAKTDGGSNFQLLLESGGNNDLRLYSVGASAEVIQSGNLNNDTFYKLIIKRHNGRLVSYLNDVTQYDELNTWNLTSQPSARLFAKSTNAEGTTHTNYSNHYLLLGSFTLTNIDAWEQSFNKLSLQQFGI